MACKLCLICPWESVSTWLMLQQYKHVESKILSITPGDDVGCRNMYYCIPIMVANMDSRQRGAACIV